MKEASTFINIKVEFKYDEKVKETKISQDIIGRIQLALDRSDIYRDTDKHLIIEDIRVK